MPAYNAERWIKEAIISCINQTWSNKELIIVNDGSQDNTLKIAKQFEGKYIKVATQDNMGAAAARNKALAIANGEFIQWLDADDLLAPDKLSQQLKYYIGHTRARVLYSSSFGKFHYFPKNSKFIANALWQDLNPIEWLLIKFNFNYWMANSTWLINRELIEQAGPWDERLSMDDDGEYACRIVAKSEAIKFVAEARSYYRQVNIGSISRSTSEKASKSLLSSTCSSINHLISLEDSERTRAACLKYLQRWLYHFYPEKPSIYPDNEKSLCELLDTINHIADKLGGKLTQPEVNWKYKLTKKIFGMRLAMYIRNLLSYSKLFTSMCIDRLDGNL